PTAINASSPREADIAVCSSAILQAAMPGALSRTRFFGFEYKCSPVDARECAIRGATCAAIFEITPSGEDVRRLFVNSFNLIANMKKIAPCMLLFGALLLVPATRAVIHEFNFALSGAQEVS